MQRPAMLGSCCSFFSKGIVFRGQKITMLSSIQEKERTNDHLLDEPFDAFGFYALPDFIDKAKEV